MYYLHIKFVQQYPKTTTSPYPTMPKFTQHQLTWHNKPSQFTVEPTYISITTQPNTDYWQKTFYNFQNDTGPILSTEIKDNFTFHVQTAFKYNKLYDQCGIMLYQDSDNWCKIGAEFQNQGVLRLGSVVTNLGYSDWATTDISTQIHRIWLRLSRRSQDFLIQYSYDNKEYHQMRMFHMHKPIQAARVGLYASSPLKSSFKAEFFNPTITQNEWKDYKAPQN